MTRILLRPLRADTWRELAFVLLGGLMAVVGFCVQVAGLSGAERTHRRVLAVLAYLRST